MNKYTLILAAAGSALCIAANANPVPLAGSIAFGGGTYVANGTGLGGLTGATALTVITGETVQTPTTGSYAPLLNDAAIFNTPISLGLGAYSPHVLFFTVVDGLGDIWKFYDDSTTSSLEALPGVWIAQGTGDATEFASDGTTVLGQSRIGTWNFSANASGDSLTFDGTGTSPRGVPDGGLTVALLGGSLIALSALRRKLTR